MALHEMLLQAGCCSSMQVPKRKSRDSLFEASSAKREKLQPAAGLQLEQLPLHLLGLCMRCSAPATVHPFCVACLCHLQNHSSRGFQACPPLQHEYRSPHQDLGSSSWSNFNSRPLLLLLLLLQLQRQLLQKLGMCRIWKALQLW